jgi:hypothetical protein
MRPVNKRAAAVLLALGGLAAVAARPQAGTAEDFVLEPTSYVVVLGADVRGAEPQFFARLYSRIGCLMIRLVGISMRIEFVALSLTLACSSLVNATRGRNKWLQIKDSRCHNLQSSSAPEPSLWS